jgi:hypothetical protein
MNDRPPLRTRQKRPIQLRTLPRQSTDNRQTDKRTHTNAQIERHNHDQMRFESSHRAPSRTRSPFSPSIFHRLFHLIIGYLEFTASLLPLTLRTTLPVAVFGAQAYHPRTSGFSAGDFPCGNHSGVPLANSVTGLSLTSSQF